MWTVVLELEGQPPTPVASYRKLEDAQATGLRLAEQYHGTGGKVTIAQPDSSDQLQQYSKGWQRQEPEQPATGEDATVIVANTAHLGRITR